MRICRSCASADRETAFARPRVRPASICLDCQREVEAPQRAVQRAKEIAAWRGEGHPRRPQGDLLLWSGAIGAGKRA
jgi:hypothetical protein